MNAIESWTTTSDQQSQTPSPPPKVPAPGTVPKLPQTIFNLEKRGGRENSARRPQPR